MDDIIAVVDPDKALPMIEKIQDYIYNNCTRGNIYNDYYNTITHALKNSTVSKTDEVLEKEKILKNLSKIHQYLALHHTSEINPYPTARQIRDYILSITNDNDQISAFILHDNPNHSVLNTHQAALEALNFVVPNNDVDVEKQLTGCRQDLRQTYFKSSVAYTSGCGTLTMMLCNKLSYTENDMKLIMKYLHPQLTDLVSHTITLPSTSPNILNDEARIGRLNRNGFNGFFKPIPKTPIAEPNNYYSACNIM